MRSSWVGLVSFAVLALASTADAQTLARTAMPTSPTTPTPAAPVAPAATDAPNPDDPVDRLSILTGMARGKGRRVTREVRLAENDLPTMVAAIRRTDADGTENVFFVYEVSRFNQCVFAQHPEGRPAQRAAREACRETRGVLTKLGLARVAPTPPGRAEDSGGAIAIVRTVELGIRSARPDLDGEQTYFDGLGALDVAPASGLRLWVATTRGTFEEVNESRGEDLRSSWFVSLERTLEVYDAELLVANEVELGNGEDAFQRRSEYEGPGANAPTVAYDGRTKVLRIRSGDREVRLAYVAADDSLVETR